MSGRRTILGLSLLCALFVCAISAASASAVGTTAFTCVQGPTPQFVDEHCTSEGPGTKKFEHVEIAVGTTTEITATNDTTGTTDPVVIHSILGGVEFTIDANKVHLTGSCKNETVGEVMQNHCKDVVIAFSELSVTPAALKCSVLAGEIKTNKITTVTREEGGTKGAGVNHVPEGAGTPFAEFKIGGAECKLGKEFTIKLAGNFVGVPSGATVQYTEKSTKGEGAEGLFIGKSPASLTGVLTERMLGGNPTSLTTK
jgi:hypothetical protein